MEILQQNIRSVTLSFIDDSEEGVYEVDIFLSSLMKLKKTINAAGFANKFTKEEKALWNDIFGRFVFPDDKGASNVSSVNNLQFVPGEKI